MQIPRSQLLTTFIVCVALMLMCGCDSTLTVDHCTVVHSDNTIHSIKDFEVTYYTPDHDSCGWVQWNDGVWWVVAHRPMISKYYTDRNQAIQKLETYCKTDIANAN